MSLNTTVAFCDEAIDVFVARNLIPSHQHLDEDEVINVERWSVDLPLGPKVQYATEKKWDNLDICVYPGANGEFVLYEDEFDNYNYEKGMFSTIKFSWDDASRTLTISDRNGEFPKMLKRRNFRITLMQPGKQSAETVMVKADKKVAYSGKKLVVKL